MGLFKKHDAIRGHEVRPIDQGQTLLGGKFEWSQANAFEGVLAGTGAVLVKCTSPSPISTKAKWAKGAKSPDAPTEPREGITGVALWFSSSNSVVATTGRAPEWPRAKLAAKRSIMPRTTGGWKWFADSSGMRSNQVGLKLLKIFFSMRWRDSEPNPVLTP